jgi:hypothetical protein
MNCTLHDGTFWELRLSTVEDLCIFAGFVTSVLTFVKLYFVDQVSKLCSKRPKMRLKFDYKTDADVDFEELDESDDDVSFEGDKNKPLDIVQQKV